MPQATILAVTAVLLPESGFQFLDEMRRQIMIPKILARRMEV